MDLLMLLMAALMRVYDTENSDMLRSASNRTRSFINDDSLLTDFEAKWLLLVTWDHVPQFPVESNIDNTATFQAALMTDGIYSFVIFNYEIGGMQWNPRILSEKNLVIGYGVGKSGEMNNVQLNSNFFPTEDSRYYPDIIGNTGLEGQWFYRLEDNNDLTINYRQYCTDWRKSEYEDLNRIQTCPCSIFQAFFDFRYGFSQRGLPGRLEAANNVGGQTFSDDLINDIENAVGTPFCFQPRFAWFGSTVRCCYRNDGSLIEGYGTDVFASSFVQKYQYIEGFFFDSTAYYNWFYSDLIPRYTCCEKSNDPYYCDLYTEVRPKATCTNYRPPFFGWMFGDPHMRTLDEFEYTFNGLGEFILATIDDDFFVLQGRMEIPKSDDESVQATAFTAFAAQENGTSKVQMTLNDNATDFDILINGSFYLNKTILNSGAYMPPNDPEIIISLPNTNSTGYRVQVTWSSGLSISVGLTSSVLDVVLSVPEEYKGKTKGLYGR
ncbi:mucin-like protein [Antedon mediterranea]|uniref:mucin-like protein n=1 Tax=Antedon mediterranea TaxID=105859 RepID=UPI003AF452D8